MNAADLECDPHAYAGCRDCDDADASINTRDEEEILVGAPDLDGGEGGVYRVDTSLAP